MQLLAQEMDMTQIRLPIDQEFFLDGGAPIPIIDEYDIAEHNLGVSQIFLALIKKTEYTGSTWTRLRRQ